MTVDLDILPTPATDADEQMGYEAGQYGTVIDHSSQNGKFHFIMNINPTETLQSPNPTQLPTTPTRKGDPGYSRTVELYQRTKQYTKKLPMFGGTRADYMPGEKTNEEASGGGPLKKYFKKLYEGAKTSKLAIERLDPERIPLLGRRSSPKGDIDVESADDDGFDFVCGGIDGPVVTPREFL